MDGDGQEVVLDLGESGTLVVVAEHFGPVLVSRDEITAKLSAVTGPIGRVAQETLEALKRAKPSKAVVEVAFGLAIEQGQLVALLGKAHGEASIKVTLEWSGAAEGPSRRDAAV